ncbi:MAG: Hpt domain-containing protein [Enterocloster sp.]
MTIQECYKAIGGNYEAVLGRLHSEALIQRFTLKFLEDQSYLQLKQALENKNYEDAFRSAHTLKGVCQNLSFDRLYEVSNELTELLRDRTGEKPGIPEAMEKVTEVYEMTIEEIKKGRVALSDATRLSVLDQVLGTS